MLKTYKVAHGDPGEILIIPTFTPNPAQWRLGIRIGGVTVWLRKEMVKEVIEELSAQVKT